MARGAKPGEGGELPGYKVTKVHYYPNIKHILIVCLIYRSTIHPHRFFKKIFGKMDIGIHHDFPTMNDNGIHISQYKQDKFL